MSIVAPEGIAAYPCHEANPTACAALRGVASHSYSYSITEDHAQVVAGTGKEYWMTEASENGQDSTSNDDLGYSTIARVLNDVNHYAAHGVWFIGFYRAETDIDSKTKLINYQPSSNSIQIWPKSDQRYRARGNLSALHA